MNDLVPSEFYLSQNYPNPFRDKTTIKFCVAYRTKVKLEVYNSEGKLIQKLLAEEKEAGTYAIEFSAIGGSASGGDALDLASEVFFYQLEAGEFISRKKMLMIK